MAIETATLRRAAAALAAALLPLPVLGQGAVTPAETGQTASYDANTPRRDDGAVRSGVAWPAPRFTDNGDGTLTDELTRLVWLKQASCMTVENWQGALSKVVQLNAGSDFSCSGYAAGSYGDWHLPNLREAESLLAANVVNHATWLGGQGFLGVVYDEYFTSTSLNGATAWVLSLPLGSVSTVPKSSSRYVWPVRGTTASPLPLPRTGQTTSYDSNFPPRDDGALQTGVAWPNPRFIDHGDGSISDELTGLTWLADANCIEVEYPGVDGDGTPGDGAVTWQHALDFVAGVDAGAYPLCGAGRSDWRLPNRREMFSLIDSSQLNPALPAGHPFLGVGSEEYWTSTTRAGLPALADVLYMAYGYWAFRDKLVEPRLVWLVRGGPEIFADGFELGGFGQWTSAVGGS